MSSEDDHSKSYKRFEDSDDSSGSSLSKSPSPEREGDEDSSEMAYHTIVIDCAPMGFVDSMGITVLEQVTTPHIA